MKTCGQSAVALAQREVRNACAIAILFWDGYSRWVGYNEPMIDWFSGAVRKQAFWVVSITLAVIIIIFADAAAAHQGSFQFRRVAPVVNNYSHIQQVTRSKDEGEDSNQLVNKSTPESWRHDEDHEDDEG